MLRRVAVMVALAGLGALVGWPAVGPARGDVLAAPKAVRLVTASGHRPPGRWQAWANSSLVPTVRKRVTLRLTGCPRVPKAAGCVYTSKPLVVYLRPDLRNPRGVFLHELGHIYDLTVLADRDRDRFRKIMRAPASRQWWVGKTPLAEWFAEGYSWCARYAHIVSIERYAIYHYRPTAKQHVAVCKLIRQAARNRAPAVPPRVPPVVTGDPAPPPPPPVSPGVVPGDPQRDPGRAQPTPTPTPTATPTRVPTLPIPTIRIPTPTPTPTEEPVLNDPPLPTITPWPTETPEPTETPAPTETPEATETPDPDPTETPTPTEEPTPAPRHHG